MTALWAGGLNSYVQGKRWLGWKRCASAEGLFQTLAVAPDFHTSGPVLAGAESVGLWRSTDGEHHFEQAPEAPGQVNALAANVEKIK